MKRKFLIFIFLAMFTVTVSNNLYAQEKDENEHVYSIPNLSFKAEKIRLDAAADKLKRFPEKVVYLIGYSDLKKGKKSALDRLLKSQKYLVQKHCISVKRIFTHYAGTDKDGVIMNVFVMNDNESNENEVEKQEPS